MANLTTTSPSVLFADMPVDKFIVTVTLCGIFLLAIPLNLLAITSIIARSALRTVNAIDTYVLNACLAYVWQLLASLLPYLVGVLIGGRFNELFGILGCLFVPFLRYYPLYVLATLVTALSVHACRAAPLHVRRRHRPAEWPARVAVTVAWLSGLIAVLEIFVHKLVGTEQCEEDRSDTIIFYASRVVGAVVTCFLPFLAVFLVFPLACCHMARGETLGGGKGQESSFPIYRLNSYPQPTFTSGHLTLAFFIGLVHWCCLTPLVAARVINTVDETFMAESFARWMPYFECVHYAPTCLVPMMYVITLSAGRKA